MAIKVPRSVWSVLVLQYSTGFQMGIRGTASTTQAYIRRQIRDQISSKRRHACEAEVCDVSLCEGLGLKGSYRTRMCQA